MALAEHMKKNRLEALKALRQRIAAEIDSGTARPSEVAALAGRLTILLKQIEELEKAAADDTKDSVDDLAKRRASRRANPKGVRNTAGKSDNSRTGSG